MSRIAQFAGIILIAAALLGLESSSGPPAAVDLPAAATLAPFAAAPPPNPDAVASPLPPAATPTAAPGREIAGARIVIARLSIDLPLVWGDLARDVPRDNYAGATPERAALVFPGSALPGAGGNTYIYSHARTGMFLTLWNVRAGDIVELRWPDGTLRYSIQRIVPRVDPTDTSWLDPRGPERLTLQTSTGPRASDPRFVAVATPADGPQ